jgi:hypothetical protein
MTANPPLMERTKKIAMPSGDIVTFVRKSKYYI